MEEAWTTRFGADASVHLELFPKIPAEWSNETLVTRWTRIRTLRRVVTGALEIARRDRVIGASLEAAPVLYIEDERDAALLGEAELAEIAITSGARIVTGQTPAGAFTLPDVPGAAGFFDRAIGV